MLSSQTVCGIQQLSRAHTIREPPAHLFVSTIDHILCSKHLLSAVQCVFPIDDHPLYTSDHFPVFADFMIHLPPPLSLFSPKVSSHYPSVTPHNWARKAHNHFKSPLCNEQYHTPHSAIASKPEMIDGCLPDLTSCPLGVSKNILPKMFH